LIEIYCNLTGIVMFVYCRFAAVTVEA